MILKSYPTLDVHGETRDTVIYPVKSFIDDNIKLGNQHIVIIHGIGQGILKNTIHEMLKKDKRIVSFEQEGRNLGATLITLKVSRFDK